MKNLKIFPKMFIQIFAVMVVIIIVIHLLVFLIFPKTYLDTRKEEISSKANEIIRETQEIIADKMSSEMEIDTMMTGAKSEANIMLFMPLGILLILGYMGQGFMDAIYTTPVGRLTATFGLVIFVVSFVLTQKFSDVKL